MTTRSHSLITLLVTLSGCALGVSDGLGGDLVDAADGTGEPPAAESTGESSGSDTTDASESGDSSDGGSSDDGSSSSSSDGTDDSSGSSDGEDAEVCDPTTHACVQKPPGWKGPVVLVESAADAQGTACDSDWPEPVKVGYQGIDAAPASCEECFCGAAEGVECMTSTKMWPYTPYCDGNACYNQNGCLFMGDEINLHDGTGTLVFEVLPSRFIADPVVAIGGACAPSEAQMLTDYEPKFTTRFELCAPSDFEGVCDEGTCVPKPTQSVCVWETGELECPAEFPDKTVVFGGLVDERECTACACGAAQGSSCEDAEVRFVSTGEGPQDTIVLGTMPADGSCQWVPGIWPHQLDHAILDPGEPSDGSCTPIQSQVGGEVETTDAVTVCCEA